jgi:hypothetical protein
MVIPFHYKREKLTDVRSIQGNTSQTWSEAPPEATSCLYSQPISNVAKERRPSASLSLRFLIISILLLPGCVDTSSSNKATTQADSTNPDEDFLSNYNAYRVDINGDGLDDILLKPKPKIAIISVEEDLSFPVNINKQAGYILKATTSWGGFQQPQAVTGRLPTTSGLVKLSVYIGNTDNNQNSTEMLIQPDRRGRSGVILSNDGTALTLLDEIELGIVNGYNISSDSSTLSLSDTNNDEKDDLSITNNIDQTTVVVEANADGSFGTPPDPEDIEVMDLWFRFLNALSDRNVELASSFFISEERAKYNRVFTALEDELDTISLEFRYFKKVQWGDDFSIYAVNRFINDENHLFFVSFAQDSDGSWVIMTM